MMIEPIITVNNAYVNNFVHTQFLPVMMHSKRNDALADAVIGVLHSESLQPSAMGHGLAKAKGRHRKHCIKQIDRTLHNEDIETRRCESALAKLLIAKRSRIVVAMDWTVFAKSKHMTLTIRLITKHGRATPLLWKTVHYDNLKGKKSDVAFELFEKLRHLVPTSCQIILLADREFGTLKNMKKLGEDLEIDYILRLRRNFTVTDKTGKRQLAHEWLNENEKTCIDDAKITVQDYAVKKVVICKDKGMKDMWVLAASTENLATQTILNYYAKRWGTETSYRDEKDLQFGLGLKKARMKNIEKRDRLLLISAIAIIILTLLGAASEAVGYDKYIKANTSKNRTHSLFTQGRIILDMVWNMAQRWRDKILQAFTGYWNLLGMVTDEQFVV